MRAPPRPSARSGCVTGGATAQHNVSQLTSNAAGQVRVVVSERLLVSHAYFTGPHRPGPGIQGHPGSNALALADMALMFGFSRVSHHQPLASEGERAHNSQAIRCCDTNVGLF